MRAEPSNQKLKGSKGCMHLPLSVNRKHVHALHHCHRTTRKRQTQSFTQFVSLQNALAEQFANYLQSG